MILAIATLMLQAAAAPQPVVSAVTSAPENAVATTVATTGPAFNATLFPATPDDKAVITPKASPDGTLFDHPASTSAAVNATNSKPAGTYALNTVSFDGGQNSQAFSTIRINDPKAPKQVGVIGVESYPSRRAWWTLAVAAHSTAFFDAYTTRRAVSMGAVEDDPMMRPFAKSPAIYAAIQAGPAVFDFISHRMMHSESPFIRRMWWMPQSLSTSASLVSGVHNLAVARHMK
jgi:hypothetical protein